MPGQNDAISPSNFDLFLNGEKIKGVKAINYEQIIPQLSRQSDPIDNNADDDLLFGVKPMLLLSPISAPDPDINYSRVDCLILNVIKSRIKITEKCVMQVFKEIGLEFSIENLQKYIYRRLSNDAYGEAYYLRADFNEFKKDTFLFSIGIRDNMVSATSSFDSIIDKVLKFNSK